MPREMQLKRNGNCHRKPHVIDSLATGNENGAIICNSGPFQFGKKELTVLERNSEASSRKHEERLYYPFERAVLYLSGAEDTRLIWIYFATKPVL